MQICVNRSKFGYRLWCPQKSPCKLGEAAFRVRRNLCPKKTPILRDEVLLLKKPSSYDVWILREFKERR